MLWLSFWHQDDVFGPMIIIGIDVGLTGGLCCFEVMAESTTSTKFYKRVVDIIDMPTIHEEKTREVDVVALQRWLRGSYADHVFLERVRAMPSIPGAGGVRRSMGATSAFNFGGSFASIKTVVRLSGAPFTLIEPQTWKKRFGLKGSDKEQSRQMALRMMPDAKGYMERKLDHNRAESLLIAMYGAEQIIGQRRVAAMREEGDVPGQQRAPIARSRGARS